MPCCVMWRASRTAPTTPATRRSGRGTSGATTMLTIRDDEKFGWQFAAMVHAPAPLEQKPELQAAAGFVAPGWPGGGGGGRPAGAAGPA